MKTMEQVPASTGLKFVSLLLMIGGVVGICITFWLETNFVTNGQIGLFSPTTGIFGSFIVLFGWAAWTGRELWQRKKQALTMAKVLFALQIPLFQIPGFAYEFHVGLTVPIRIASGGHIGSGFNLGSSFSFYISSQVRGFAIGVNLAALLVFIYLMRISLAPAAPQDKFGLI
jgi:hypothetical protein